MAHRRIAPPTDDSGQDQLMLIAGILSGIACLVLVPILYRLAVLVSDSLFGPAMIRATVEGGHMVAREIAPHKWIGGLLVAFIAGAALLVSGEIRSRCRLTVKQYWAATVLLAIFCLVAAFFLRRLG